MKGNYKRKRATDTDCRWLQPFIDLDEDAGTALHLNSGAGGAEGKTCQLGDVLCVGKGLGIVVGSAGDNAVDLAALQDLGLLNEFLQEIAAKFGIDNVLECAALLTESGSGVINKHNFSSLHNLPP